MEESRDHSAGWSNDDGEQVVGGEGRGKGVMEGQDGKKGGRRQKGARAAEVDHKGGRVTGGRGERKRRHLLIKVGYD